MADRVDLVTGTKGSGKTALYRIFVDFLPVLLLWERRVVVAHGVRQRQDTVFLAHREQFDKLSEADFVDFWCVYLISLAYEQFVRSDRYKDLLAHCTAEIADFRRKYRNARIPQFERKQTLKEILAWTLEVVKHFKPRLSWTPPGGVGQFDLTFDTNTPAPQEGRENGDPIMPAHIDALTTSLQEVVSKAV